MGQKGSFRFYDHDNTDRSFQALTEEEWQQKMKDNINDVYEAEIREGTTFLLPLDIPFINGWQFNLGHNLETNHKFVIFECTSSFYLSFEKDGEGITLQRSKDEETIKEGKIVMDKEENNLKVRKRNYKEKLEKVQGTEYDFQKPLSELMGLKGKKIKDIVQNWKTGLWYSAHQSNCQHLVHDVRKIVKGISDKEAERFKFKFPGSDKDGVPLSNRENIIALYDYYCNQEKKFSALPRFLGSIDKYSYRDDSEDGKRVAKKKLKDEIDGWIDNSFDEDGPVYFKNLFQNKARENLEVKTSIATEDIKRLAEFWHTEIESIILSEKYGVIVINVTIGEEMRNVETKAEILLSELFRIGSAHIRIEVDLKFITIQVIDDPCEKINDPCKEINDPRKEIKKPFKKSEKRCMQVNVSRKDEGVFKENFEKVFKKFLSEIPSNKEREEHIKYLGGLLLVLQNTEKIDAKLFGCIINQNRETDCNHIEWSPRQRKIITARDAAFEKDPREEPGHERKSRLKLIVGCPGSGKTLILLDSCRKYCEKWTKASALFIVPDRNTCLLEQIKTRLDCERVEIQSKLPSLSELKKSNVGFIAIDEFYEEKFIDESTPMSRTMLSALEAGIHIFIATMGCYYNVIEQFTLNQIEKSGFYKLYMLGGANYRSNKAILNLVDEVQKEQRNDENDERDIYSVLLNESSFMPISQNAVQLKYMTEHGLKSKGNDEEIIQGDTSLNRSSFIDKCVEYILSQIKDENKPLLDAGKVLIYNICHYSIFLQIKKKLEDQSLEKDGKITKEQYENLVFEDPRACQGAEYAYSIAIMDHASIPYKPLDAIVIGLTRTILCAHLLINIAQDPPFRRLDQVPVTQNPDPQKSHCIEFDVLDGTSRLREILERLRNGKKNFTVLFSEDDDSIPKDQIDKDIKKIRTVPSFPFYNDVKLYKTWKGVDVIIGSPKFYSNYQNAWSPIHSCNATFVVTYRKEETSERIDTSEVNYGNNHENNEIIRKLVHKFNSNYHGTSS